MSQYNEELHCDIAGLESTVGSKCIAIGKNCIARVCNGWKNCIATWGVVGPGVLQ